MREFSPIGYAIGLVLTVAGMAMVLPMFKELLDGSSDTWQPFLLAAALTIATGLSLCLAFQHKKEDRQTAQQSLFLMVAIWIVVPVFGSLPFLFAESPLSITDSIFESMSGFTTTGSTILDNLDAQSDGTLLWRGLLQWMGGMGVVIAAMVFPASAGHWRHAALPGIDVSEIRGSASAHQFRIQADRSGLSAADHALRCSLSGLRNDHPSKPPCMR